jgi:hypothetical protein
MVPCGIHHVIVPGDGSPHFELEVSVVIKFQPLWPPISATLLLS